MRRAFLAILTLAVLGTGCAARKSGIPPSLEGRLVPESAMPMMVQLQAGGPRDWVLHLDHMASQSMMTGDREFAKAALDAAVLEINNVFGTTTDATKARTLFFGENAKQFKGDPYERAMTFLYRGVLYMQDGDYENARAMFRSGVLQDTFAEESQDKADWQIFDYLIAVCEAQMDRPFYAEEAYNRAIAIGAGNGEGYAKASQSPLLSTTTPLRLPVKDDNLLIIAQTGRAPRKLKAGEYGEYLTYKRGGIVGPAAAMVSIAGVGDILATMTDSVYYQAATRGGRPFDRIAGKKAFFKGGSEKLGSAAVAGGALLFAGAGDHDNGGAALVGAGLVGLGALLTGFAALIKPDADDRQWTTIPDAVGIVITEAQPGTHAIRFQPDGDMGSEAVIDVPEKGKGMAVAIAFPGPQPFILLPPSKGVTAP